jgi:tRNA(Ile2) C34 agmatinyltransferase TiaS
MSAAQHTPGPRLTDGLTEKQLALHPMCRDCGWRMGGLDSWDGARCKCRKSAPSFRKVLDVAMYHEERAEAAETLDADNPASAYHATRASAIRAAIAKATGSAA